MSLDAIGLQMSLWQAIYGQNVGLDGDHVVNRSQGWGGGGPCGLADVPDLPRSRR